MIDTWIAELPHGIHLSCRSAGSRGRPVLMFLHGFPEAAFVWDDLLEHFARPEHGGYRCVAPNLRGYEQSSSPTEPAAYRPKPLMEDIAALITLECGADEQLACLIAHDWGGALAWSLASLRPELMARLVIVNSPHPQTFLRELKGNPRQQAASAYMNFLIRADAEDLLAANDYARLWPFFGAGPLPSQKAPPRGAADHAQQGSVGVVFDAMGASGALAPAAPANLPEGAGWMTESLRAKYRAVWDGEGKKPGAGLTGGLNYYRASALRPPRAEDPAAANIELPADAFTVTTPTLVLWGMQDTALPPELIEGLEAWVPHMTLTRMERATHWVVHEQPERVAAEISRFLR